MRVEELYLDGFGHFHQRAIGPITEPVTVFYGPNEAGKSTLLAFIRATLFGFPARFNAHYPPLAGGRHGGRIVLRDDVGVPFNIERFAGARGGLVITTPEGQTGSPDALMRRLTGNATPDLFRNVFAFSLDELQAAASLNDASGAIYSAGQGAPALRTLMNTLDDRKSSIYRPRGNNQSVPTLLTQLKSVEDELRTIDGNAERYGALTTRKSQIDSELGDAEGSTAELSAKQGEINRLLDAWDDWVPHSAIEAQLVDLPRYDDFPESPLPRLESLEERVRQAREDRDAATRQLQQTERAAEAIIPGEDLLYDLERIEAMRRDRNRFDAAVRDLPERQGELRNMEADFAKVLADLGHDWDETGLGAIDTSLVVRNQVDVWKGQISEATERARVAQIQVSQEQRNLQDCESETREARDKLPAELPPLNSDELAERTETLRAARGRLTEYERQRQNHETLQGQLNTLTVAQGTQERESGHISLLPIIVLVLAGSVLAVAGILLGGGALILGVVCGLVLLVAATMLWMMRGPAPPAEPSPMAVTLGQQAGDAERAMGVSLDSLMSSAADLGLDAQPDSPALDSVEARQDAARNLLAAWKSARERLDGTSRREKLQINRLEVAVTEHESSLEAAEDSRREWRQWLGERGLNQTLTPDAMAEFLARIEAARGALLEIQRMRDRVAAIEHDIREFRNWVEPLAERHGLAVQSEDSRHVALIADEIIRRLNETQAAFSARERAREQAEEDGQALATQEGRLLSAEEELTQLMAGAGTDDSEEFRRRARQHADRQELERQHSERRRGLERICGPGERFDAFCLVLKTADPDRLREESAHLQDRRSVIGSRRDALREERGGIDTELARLTSEEESSALRVRRHTLVEQLEEHAREWSRLTIAEELLSRTRQRFEQERQPSVIRHAQEFFSRVTGRRYNRLFAPIGEQSITVIDDAGASKQPNELSRGTREQLYLALRFGLIREFGEHAERLPVVVDEALVNFDPGRAHLAAEAFADLSTTNQVLVFTCHPSVAEMFADAAGAQVVDIRK